MKYVFDGCETFSFKKDTLQTIQTPPRALVWWKVSAEQKRHIESFILESFLGSFPDGGFFFSHFFRRIFFFFGRNRIFCKRLRLWIKLWNLQGSIKPLCVSSIIINKNLLVQLGWLWTSSLVRGTLAGTRTQFKMLWNLIWSLNALMRDG